MTFDERYSRARDIARYPANFIRTCDGEDLMGVPARDPFGQPLTDSNGRVVWQSRPRAGWIPTPDVPGSWSPVPFLAYELRCTQVDQANTVALRITPEVRVEKGGAGLVVNVRTLTIEASVLVEREIKAAGVRVLAESFGPYLKPFFPLHAQVLSESIAGPMQQHDALIRSQSLLYRFRAHHEDVLARLDAPGDEWSI